MKKVRVGVIGVGYLGQFHAEKYAAIPDTELAGIVDTDPVRAAQIAKKLNTLAYSDPAQLLGRVDAVSIVVPTVFHHRIAKQFLKQGIHVLLEKPMTATLEQADELIELAAGKKLVLQVGHIERFNPAVTVVKALLKAPRYMAAERSAPFTVRCTDVNVILDLMIHDLDIVMDLAGSAPHEVSAAGASVITKEIDSASARIIFQNGCVADVTASRVSD
jgi:predicted dehydrogenase